MPVANTSDGVAVKKKISRILFDLYDIKASRVIKRMTTSEAMNN